MYLCDWGLIFGFKIFILMKRMYCLYLVWRCNVVIKIWIGVWIVNREGYFVLYKKMFSGFLFMFNLFYLKYE